MGFSFEIVDFLGLVNRIISPKAVGSRGYGVNHGHVARRIRLSDVGRPHRDPTVPPLPPEEVADHDELHECGDEHGDSASHGIVSGAYMAPAPPNPPAPTVAPPVPPTVTLPVPPIVTPLIPLVAPPVPLAAPCLIPPIVSAAPFQLSLDLGAFWHKWLLQLLQPNLEIRGSYEKGKKDAFFRLIQGSLTVRKYVDRFEDLYYFVSDILPSEEAKCDQFKQGLHVEIRASMTWFRGSNFSELVEATVNVEKVKQEEKEYEQKQVRNMARVPQKALGRDQLREEVVHFSLERSLVAMVGFHT
ncbi:hypothetical protein GH714_014705 [Hevea brasiliensis]|uniref:Retrotransposon gag domain-containing protein n=1 Tax=Hevea brasiliensis TaxID=3981 RepID=A0A6A6LAF1_HEVBR|nr:hypothetical protein GH714_014705 [Hevea brasiliensis]